MKIKQRKNLRYGPGSRCSVRRCVDPPRAGGMCDRHYQAEYRLMRREERDRARRKALGRRGRQENVR